MVMLKALRRRDDVDRLYALRKEGERGLANIEDSVDATVQRLEDYLKKRKGKLITTTGGNIDNVRTNKTKITGKQKWDEKQLSGYFKWQTSKISHEKIWMWRRKGNLKIETESLQKVAQNNAIRTNYIKIAPSPTPWCSSYRKGSLRVTLDYGR